MFELTEYGGPKLLCVDLETDEVIKKILFPKDVALPTTYLNDVRFDLRRGEEGTAFITDSSDKGPNGIIVVDLAPEESWRCLHDHPTTKAEQPPDFLPMVEGRPLMERNPDGTTNPITMGSDGIAIGADGERLYYCKLMGRHLYSVSTDALCNRSLGDGEVARTVTDEGDKGGSGDGMETDAAGNLYATNFEHNALPGQRVGDSRARPAPAVAGHHVRRGRRLPLRHGQPVAPPGPVPGWRGRTKEAIHAVSRPHRRRARRAEVRGRLSAPGVPRMVRKMH